MTADSERPEKADRERIGDVIDTRYRITGLLGQGGVGTVYRAEHLGIRREVAVKLLRPDLASLPEIMDRFEREAYATGRVDHPNCVTVSDFGKLEDGTLYLVMEVLEGAQLSDILEREERVDVDRAVHIVRHVLRGLAHAHRAGIVHRDIKPENVFLVEHDGDSEFAKILDFGLAKLVGPAAGEEGKRLTRVGLTFGTPVYMSPEQASGQEIDGRTDLYALSIMLYEMIAGRPPFDSDDPLTVLPMHISCEVPPFAEVAPDVEVPAALEQLIRRGLAKRREDRIASAKDYLHELNEIMASGGDDAEVGRPAARRIASGAPVTVPTIYTSAFEESSAAEASPARPQPEAPVAAPGNARKLILLGAAIASVAFIILFLLFGRGGAVDIAAEARAMVEQGHPDGAIAYLEAKQDAVDQNADALLVLAHANVELKRYTKGLEVYQRAIALRPQPRDEAMVGDLKRMLDSRKASVRETSLDVIETLLANGDDPAAADLLVATASANENRATRGRAVSMTAKLGIADRVDRLRSYTLDLEQGKTCADRKRAVEQLHALGDSAAIEALQNARNRKRGRKNTNECLLDELEAALRDLGAGE